MSDHGAKVSEVGFGVESADIENLIFSSSYPFFKIHTDSTSNLNIPANAVGATITFTHSLGYVPSFIMYSTAFALDTYSRPIPRGVSPQPIFASSYSTSSGVVFKMKLDGLQGAFSITVRCITFKDKVF